MLNVSHYLSVTAVDAPTMPWVLKNKKKTYSIQYIHNCLKRYAKRKMARIGIVQPLGHWINYFLLFQLWSKECFCALFVANKFWELIIFSPVASLSSCSPFIVKSMASPPLSPLSRRSNTLTGTPQPSSSTARSWQIQSPASPGSGTASRCKTAKSSRSVSWYIK